MKIDLGHGAYIEPEEGPRDTPFHKRIVETKPIPNTRAGNLCLLECGHQVMTFGNLEHADGIVPCVQCRDRQHESVRV